MDIVTELNNSPSLAQAFFRIAKASPDLTVYSQAELSPASPDLAPECRERIYINRTYREVELRVRKIASYLIASGVKPGDRVAIISNSRSEWMEADLAILSCGAVSVSVYQSLLPHDIGYILHDSQSKVVFAENEEQVKKLQLLTESDTLIPEVEDRRAQSVRLKIDTIITFENADNLIGNVNLSDILESEAGNAALAFEESKRDDIASLVYTSGTTGPAKGVIQTNGNHLSNIRQAYQSGIFKDDSVLIVVLPLAHSFAKLMGYICFLTTARAAFPAVADKKTSKLFPDSLTKDIAMCGATIFPLVPRMLEKMKEGIIKKSKSKGFLSGLIKKTIQNAKARGDILRAGRVPDAGVNLKYALFSPLRKLIRKKLFGSNFQYAISGGAKLSVDVAYFFDDFEIEVLEGYGLTETCVATNVNRYGFKKTGTVGPVLYKDIELTLSEEGEILFRGPNITRGYLNRPQATKASWDEDGRFHTGDLGSIDQDGFLSITGRKKELIVTAGGKKIAPEMIENKIKNINFVSQAVIVGEGKPYCAALLTVNFSDAKKSIDSGGDTADEEIWTKLEKLFKQELEVLNSSLASFESIKKIEVLKEDFTIENGLLTPTLKVKRNEVYKRYKDLIDKFYQSNE